MPRKKKEKNGDSESERAWRALSEIKSIRVQGATNVAIEALKALNSFGSGLEARNRSSFLKKLEGFARKLENARPTEPAEKRAIKRVLERVKSEEGDVTRLKKVLFVACKEEIERLKSIVDNVVENASGLVEDGDVILVHCHSTTVVRTLKRAWSKGRRFRVYSMEARPLYQGRITARELAEAGIPVTQIVDSACGRVLREKATKVFVGCDALLPRGFINKIGTSVVCWIAKKHGIPVYVLGPTTKMASRVEIEEREPGEVWPDRPPGVEIWNPAFDETPYELVEGVVTEEGLFSPEEFKKKFGKETGN